MMKRTNQTALTPYRRHAKKVCALTNSRILDKCECPLWVHGKIDGQFIRVSLDTRHLPSALAKVEAMQNGDGPGPKGGGENVVAIKPSGEITLEYAVQDFLETKTKKASNTRALYERAVGHFSEWAAAKNLTTLAKIDDAHGRAYFQAFDRDWKTSTAQGRLTHLRVFFNHCVRERHWLQYSPLASRDMNYGGKKGKVGKRRMPFKPAEVTRILVAVEQMPEADRDRARALILLLLYTGMRISDATFAERSDVDADNALVYTVIKTGKEISLPPTLQQTVLDALAKLPATRIYFFQPDAADDYREARTALREGHSGEGREFSTLMPRYTPRVAEMTRLVLAVLKLAGLSGACHRFRDTFAINMLTGDGGANRADILSVSLMLGHSDVEITKNHYVKLVPGYREHMSSLTRVLAYQFPAAG